MSTPTDVSANLAANIKQLREVRGLTQDRLAKLSGLPRPTWANLESGSANPTVSVLVKAAAALQVSVEELIGPPRSEGRLYLAQEIPIKMRDEVTIRKLLPDTLQNMELDRMELPPHSRMSGVPHRPGTREYLTCEAGLVEIVLSGQKWVLHPGDVFVFRGDQRHSYANPADETAIAYSVVLFGAQGPY
ncbi:MAG: helix-turn-helix domain-containing protein [Blastocatellia bacterium]|nr:helix-turn-helix domain-containing protein [Blastocatellia bacterium]